VAAHVIRQVATADVRLESVGSVVRYCLSGLSARWPLALRKNSLLRQCAFDLKLLPKALDEAREAIDAYVEEG
jgi:hypothetical protein